eukprot:458289_1
MLHFTIFTMELFQLAQERMQQESEQNPISKEQATQLIVSRYVTTETERLFIHTNNAYYTIPSPISTLIAHYIGNWFSNHGVYQWKVTNKALVDKMLNASCGDEFKSPIFYLSRLQCQLTIYPNGSSKELEGFFVIHLHFIDLPSSIDCITFTRVFRVKESMTGSTWRSMVTNGDYEYWSKHCPLFELQKLDVSTITIEVEINIERLVYDTTLPTRLWCEPVLKNTCFPRESHIEYKFDESTIQIMQYSKGLKSMCSEIADNMWVMTVYPKENMEIYLKMCFIPPGATQFKVQTVMQCKCGDQIIRSRTATNIYTEEHHSWGPSEWVKLSAIAKMKHMEFVIDIKILSVFDGHADVDGHVTNETDIAWLLSSLYNKQ